jgi:hypothetical protein
VRALGLADGRSRSVSPAICLVPHTSSGSILGLSPSFVQDTSRNMAHGGVGWDRRGAAFGELNIFLADRDGLVTCTITVPSNSLFA